MSDEEREKVLENCERSRESYNWCVKEGLDYDWSRDICKEMRDVADAEDKHKHENNNNVTEYCSILQTQNQHLESKVINSESKIKELENKNNELENAIIKHNILLSQIVEKLNNIV